MLHLNNFGVSFVLFRLKISLWSRIFISLLLCNEAFLRNYVTLFPSVTWWIFHNRVCFSMMWEGWSHKNFRSHHPPPTKICFLWQFYSGGGQNRLCLSSQLPISPSMLENLHLLTTIKLCQTLSCNLHFNESLKT